MVLFGNITCHVELVKSRGVSGSGVKLTRLNMTVRVFSKAKMSARLGVLETSVDLYSNTSFCVLDMIRHTFKKHTMNANVVITIVFFESMCVCMCSFFVDMCILYYLYRWEDSTWTIKKTGSGPFFFVEMKTIVVFLGAPGSGKGTQASIMCRQGNMQHLAVGHVLRVASRSDEKIRKLLDTGKTFPPSVVHEAVRKTIDLNQDGWVFDGYPRSVAQYYESFLPLFDYIREGVKGDVNVKVIHLSFPSEKTMELYMRVSCRYECVLCGTPFSYRQKMYDVCKCKDLASFAFRMDDDTEMFAKRINEYNEVFRELVLLMGSEYGRDFHVIDAEKSIMEVTKAVCECVSRPTGSGP